MEKEDELKERKRIYENGVRYAKYLKEKEIKEYWTHKLNRYFYFDYLHYMEDKTGKYHLFSYPGFDEIKKKLDEIGITAEERNKIRNEAYIEAKRKYKSSQFHMSEFKK